jgi:hypothetical protein
MVGTLTKRCEELDQDALDRVTFHVYGVGVRVITADGQSYTARIQGTRHIFIANEDSGTSYVLGITQGLEWITKTCHPVWIHPDGSPQEDLYGSSPNIPPHDESFYDLVHHFHTNGITIYTLDCRLLFVYSLGLRYIFYQDADTGEWDDLETAEPLTWITETCHPALIHPYDLNHITLYGSDEAIPQND